MHVCSKGKQLKNYHVMDRKGRHLNGKNVLIISSTYVSNNILIHGECIDISFEKIVNFLCIHLYLLYQYFCNDV